MEATVKGNRLHAQGETGTPWRKRRDSAEAIPLSNHPYACCSLKTQLSYQGQLLNQGFSLYTTDLILLQQSLGSVIFHYIICRRDEVSM